MSLSPKQTAILHLIKRSDANDEGWYRVSKMIWPLVARTLPSDIVEAKATEDGGLIRFTDRGRAVADYL